MVVGMQHQQQQPHASPATVLEDATTPCAVPPPSAVPSTVAAVNGGDTSDGSEGCSSTDTGPVSVPVTKCLAMSAMANAKYSNSRVKLRDVNPHLVCVLCHGYFVDATSIAECLHSFCRSCIILYLGTKNYCPICEVQINNSKPHLSLKPDKTLQDIVYKLVPGLFHAEMIRRNKFYQDHPYRDLYLHPECRGIVVDRLVYGPGDEICVSLVYYDKSKEEEEWETVGSHRVNYKPSKESTQEVNLSPDDKNNTMKKHFYCPATVRVRHLKKIIRLKYNLEDDNKVELFYRRESLPDDYSLMDIAYIYAWKRNTPMRLFYKMNILTTVPESTTEASNMVTEENSSQLSVRVTNADHDDEAELNEGAVERSPNEVVALAKEEKKLCADDGKLSEDVKPVISDRLVVTSKTQTTNTITTVAKSKTNCVSNGGMLNSTPKGAVKVKNGHEKKESTKSKSKVTIPNLKPINGDKNRTPIKSYLSISSILSDIEKPDGKKPASTKSQRKPEEPKKTPTHDGTSTETVTVTNGQGSGPVSPTKPVASVDNAAMSPVVSTAVVKTEPLSSPNAAVLMAANSLITLSNCVATMPVEDGKPAICSGPAPSDVSGPCPVTTAQTSMSTNLLTIASTTTASSVSGASSTSVSSSITTRISTPVTSAVVTTRASTPVSSGGTSRASTPAPSGGTSRASTPAPSGGTSRASTPAPSGGTSGASTTVSSSNTSRASTPVPCNVTTTMSSGVMNRVSTPASSGGVTSRISTPAPSGRVTSRSGGVTSRVSTPVSSGSVTSRVTTPVLSSGVTSRVSTPISSSITSRVLTPVSSGGVTSKVSTSMSPSASSRVCTPVSCGITSRVSPSVSSGLLTRISTPISSRAPTSTVPSGLLIKAPTPVSSRASTPASCGTSAKVSTPVSVPGASKTTISTTKTSTTTVNAVKNTPTVSPIVSKASPSNSAKSATTLAKSLSIPSSTSITMSSKSLTVPSSVPPLITLTSTPSTTSNTYATANSQYILSHTKIPSSLEISLTSSKESNKPSPVANLQKMVQQNFVNGNVAVSANNKGKPDESAKQPMKRPSHEDKKNEPEMKICRQNSELTVSTNGSTTKKIFTPNILPEVSITLNPHPEQNKRISPETSYDVSCFKPKETNGVPPLTPINTAPVCKNIQNSPIKNLNKKLSGPVRVIRNSSVSPKNRPKPDTQSDEPEAKKPRMENGIANGTVAKGESNGGEKSPSKPSDAKATPPKKEARHQGIPKLIDINAAPYSKLMAQNAKARLQYLNSLYIKTPPPEPVNSEDALDLSSPSSKSPTSDKSDPSPDKKKIIQSVPPLMIPVTMSNKNDSKSNSVKTSPNSLPKIERKPSPIAKMEKSPIRKPEFRLDNGSPSPKASKSSPQDKSPATPASKSYSPIFSKAMSPIGSLRFSPPELYTNAASINFLRQQRELQRFLMPLNGFTREQATAKIYEDWIIKAYQYGALPGHPLMHPAIAKPPSASPESAFRFKK